jgi:hypothetical protein
MTIALLVAALASTAVAGPSESAVRPETEPVLLRAAQVLATVIVCQEEQPAVAAHVDEAYGIWLEHSPSIWEAMHGLHFGPDPKVLQVKRQAFAQLDPRAAREAYSPEEGRARRSRSLAEAEGPPLLIPAQGFHSPASRPASAPSAADHPRSPRRYLAPGKSAVGAASVGVRDALLLCNVGDRLGPTALDPPPLAMRADKRLDQCVVASRFRCRRSSFWCHDQLSAAPALQPHRDADGQSVDLETRARSDRDWCLELHSRLRAGGTGSRPRMVQRAPATTRITPATVRGVIASCQPSSR